MGRYDGRNIGYTSPQGDTTWREATNMCIDCHHTLSGSTYTTLSGTGSSPYMRHPVTESERNSHQPINKAGAHTDPVNWVNGTNGFSIGRLPFAVAGATEFTAATTIAANNEVFCLSCHKAHGSGNAFGLRWAYGGAQNGTNQDGCIQCHNNVLNE
jgi:predicted CXXCH cytochrome family protein